MSENEPMPEPSTPKKDSLLTSRMYDILKPVVQIVLPGLGTLYFTLASIWGLPNAEQVVGTISAITVFLGLLLGVSSRTYNNSDSRFDGDLVVEETDNKKVFSLALNKDPEEFETQKQVVLKVKAA